MRVYYPSLYEFKKLAQQGNTIPVYCRLLEDQLTPVSAYARLAESRSTGGRSGSADADAGQGSDYAFLLESVVGGENIARFSFLGVGPSAIYQASGRQVTHTD